MIEYSYTKKMDAAGKVSCAALGARYALLGGKNGALTLFDVGTKEKNLSVLRSLAPASSAHRMHAVALSPDEALAFGAGTASDRAVLCFDTESGAPVRSFPTGGRLVSSLAVRADGNALFAAADDALYCWEIDTGRELFCVEDGDTLFDGLFLSDGALFATGLFPGVREYDPDTGALRMAYAAQGECESPVYDEKNGLLYAVGPYKNQTRALIWQRGKPESLDRLFCGAPASLAVLPQNGALLVLQRDQGKLRQYDVPSGAMLCRYDLRFPPGEGYMALSPDGLRVLSGMQKEPLLFTLRPDPAKAEPKEPFPLQNRWELPDAIWYTLLSCLVRDNREGVDELLSRTVDRPPARLRDMAARLWREYIKANAHPLIAFSVKQDSDNEYGVHEQTVTIRYHDSLRNQDLVRRVRASLGSGYAGCEALRNAILSLPIDSKVEVEWEAYEFDAPDISYQDSYIFEDTPCPSCHKPVFYNRWRFAMEGETVRFTLTSQEDKDLSGTVPYDALRLAALRDLREVRDDIEGRGWYGVGTDSSPFGASIEKLQTMRLYADDDDALLCYLAWAEKTNAVRAVRRLCNVDELQALCDSAGHSVSRAARQRLYEMELFPQEKLDPYLLLLLRERDEAAARAGMARSACRLAAQEEDAALLRWALFQNRGRGEPNDPLRIAVFCRLTGAAITEADGASPEETYSVERVAGMTDEDVRLLCGGITGANGDLLHQRLKAKYQNRTYPVNIDRFREPGAYADIYIDIRARALNHSSYSRMRGDRACREIDEADLGDLFVQELPREETVIRSAAARLLQELESQE